MIINFQFAWLCLVACLPLQNDPRRFPNIVDPNDPRPNKSRATVSAQAREDRGLAPRDWTGIVNPDVIPKLEWINQTVDAARTTKGIDAAQTVARVRFPEKVFVQVQLRHTQQGDLASTENKAAIKALQKRVLAGLKASEFHAKYLFDTRPGIIGYVNLEGLNNLAANPDVTGVCLDNEPIVRAPDIMTREDLPPAPPEVGADKPGVAEGKVKREVYRAFEVTERVSVMIALHSESLPEFTEGRSQRAQRLEALHRANRELINNVLSTVSADEFWLRNSHIGGMSGQITQEGLDKLWNHPKVMMIGLHTRARTQGAVR